jgi:Glycosyl transferase family 2
VAGSADYAGRIAADFPWARVVLSGLKKVPALRRRGVEEARGEFVAIIEEHCSAKEDWLAQAVRALSSGNPGAVGGPVVDYDYPRLRDWVVYFLEYNGALPPVERGETADLNDANIVYRRGLLAEHTQLLDEGYWPMTLHPTLLAKGVKLFAEPDMVVYHRGPFDFGYYLHQRYLFSRAFAGVRAQSQSRARRMAYIVGVPLVPVVLLARMTARVVRKRRRIARFFMTLPLTIPALVVMVAGEWVGYLVGPGDALSEVE